MNDNESMNAFLKALRVFFVLGTLAALVAAILKKKEVI
jgi:hypothetical protein